MNRIIKFRAWTGFEMVEIRSDAMRGVLEPELFGFKEVMQFTGLLDENGKEVWEGDIVVNKEVDPNKKWQVVYRIDSEFTGFLLHETKLKEYSLSIFTPWNQIKVIGNIHQNPELL